LKISILVDNHNSWIAPYAKDICIQLSEQHDINLYFKASTVPTGDILFLVGCTTIISNIILKRNKLNLVIHESNLPKGRGWSPVSWQVIEGKNKIPIVLFEAQEEVDSGPIYMKEYIELDGTELLPEIKQKQGKKTVELIHKFLEKWPNVKGTPQIGKSSFYPKRTLEDDFLNIEKSIIDNFNHLRVVDNEKFPAWFKFKGQKYILKIYKMN